jgi:phosphate transport system ATP-binding protein
MSLTPLPLVPPSPRSVILEAENVAIAYGGQPVLQPLSLQIYGQQITGLIGPSGCGKTTLLRCFNRLLDFVPSATVTGRLRLEGQDLLTLPGTVVRRRVGMVFQQPNPFPKSIYENIALGLRVNGCRQPIDDIVERVLHQVGLWDEVKADLGKNAMLLSGGQKQRLCIARTIALQPDIILMDEPCGALDPISSDRITTLLGTLKQRYTIVIVTHDLRQAARITDYLAFFNLVPQGDRWVGRLVEYDETPKIFGCPDASATWNYIHYGHVSI